MRELVSVARVCLLRHATYCEAERELLERCDDVRGLLEAQALTQSDAVEWLANGGFSARDGERMDDQIALELRAEDVRVLAAAVDRTVWHEGITRNDVLRAEVKALSPWLHEWFLDLRAWEQVQRLPLDQLERLVERRREEEPPA